MKAKLFLRLIVLSALMYVVPAYSQTCDYPIEKRSGQFGWATPIIKPGRYCVSDDIKVRRGGFILAEGREDKASEHEPIVKIESSNVSIDLQGHKLTADLRVLEGVRSECGLRKYHTKTGDEFCTNVSLVDGSVASRSSFGVVFAELLGPEFRSIQSDYYHKIRDGPNIDYETRASYKMTKSVEALRANFPVTGHLIQGMRITSAFPNLKSMVSSIDIVALGIQGAGNTIRGSTIQITDGQAGIYLYGPNQIIENNVIIFRGTASTPSAAPIKLHLGNGSVIRNNLFIVETEDGGSPQAAVSLIDSKDVVLENNRVFGVSALWKDWDGASSVRESGTQLLSRKPLSLPFDSRPGVR